MRDTKSYWCSRLAVAAMFTTIWMLTPSAFCQTLTTGDVTGLVKDATGAVVPNASVTLKSVDSGEVRKMVTGPSGEYRFSLLKPGDFTIMAESTGLKSDLEKFPVLVGQAAEMNLTLKVEATQSIVEVQGEANVVQTENANLETNYNTSQVINMPMAGGDLTTLAMTVPGIRVSITGGSGNMNANGIPGSSVLFTLNGHEEMDPYNNLNNSGASNNLLGANEVAEAAVVLNAYSAQYGRMAGGQVNIIGKSGSNAFHGNAYYNFNAQFLNANDFFNNSDGTPRGRSDSHQFGASFSGPVKKNKLFFFADYEAFRYVLPASGVVSLPSPQLQTYTLAHIPAASVPLYQDMFALVNAAPGVGRAVPVTNGGGVLQDANGALGCGTGTFPGTAAPGGGVFGTNVSCAVAFGTNNTQINTEGLVTPRVDYNINDKQKIFFRYNYDFGLQATGTSPISPTFNSVSNQPQHTGSLNYTYVLTPTMVNNFTGTGFWYSAIFGVADFAKTTSLMPESISIADGGANGGGFASVGAGFPTGRNVGQMELADDFSWTKDRHNIKAGVQYVWSKITYTSIASGAFKGAYTLNDLTDFATGQVNSSGLGSSFSQTFPRLDAAHFRIPALGFYVSDDWAVRHNLKLTLGMRVEHDGNPTCVDNCVATLNTPFVASGYQGGVNVPYNSTIATGVHSVFHSIQSAVYEPRFGFAWQPFGNSKTVIRGGIGIFSTHPVGSIAGTIASQAPNRFIPSVTFGTVGLATDPNSSAADAIAANNVFQNGFFAGDTLGQIKTALGKIPFGLPSFTSVPANWNLVTDTEWSFEIEHQLTQHNIVVATYVGNHGYNILESVNANMFTGTSGVSRYSGGYAGLPTAAPDPRFLSVTQDYNNGISNYDAGTIQFRHVFSYGLTTQFHYTWSHTLGTVAYENPFNLSNSYGSLNFDIRHEVAADWVWAQSHKFASHITNSLLGGWIWGGKMYVYSGAPFSVTDSKIPAQVNSAGGVLTPLADLVAPSAANTSCGKASINTPCLLKTQFATYSATSGVASPIQTDWGNTAPDSFRGPGYFDIDTQLTRDFRIKERAKVTFGLSGYNVLNHPNFANPSGSISSSSFGRITSTVTPPTSIYGSFQSGTVSGRVLVLTGRFTF
jgi:hypothetical protein